MHSMSWLFTPCKLLADNSLNECQSDSLRKLSVHMSTDNRSEWMSDTGKLSRKMVSRILKSCMVATDGGGQGGDPMMLFCSKANSNGR